MNPAVRNLGTLDRTIHEPGRLMIMALLSGVEEADFLYLLNATEMNKGTLSSHLTRLEEEGYIRITKTFKGKFPRTICRLLPAGRAAFKIYRKLIRASL